MSPLRINHRALEHYHGKDEATQARPPSLQLEVRRPRVCMVFSEAVSAAGGCWAGTAEPVVCRFKNHGPCIK